MRAFARVVCFTWLGLALGAQSASAQEANAAANGAPSSEPAPAAATPKTETDGAAATAPSTEAKATAEEPDKSKADVSDEPGFRQGEPRLTDANVDRTILFSTAETHPKGTFFFSDYELVLLQFGYAITDDLQLSVSGLPPIIKNQPYFLDLALKANFFRSDVVRLAVIGAGTVAFLPDSDPSTYFGARLNGVAQFCFDRVCRSSFSFNAGTFVNSESNLVVPITLAGGFVFHVSDLVKILAEPAYAIGVGKGVSGQPDGFLFDYGVRLSADHFGFDLAFLRPIGAGTEDFPVILGLPWVAFTYRTSGDR